MSHRRYAGLALILFIIAVAAGRILFAQGPPGPPGPPRSPQAAAPIDLTGYWVSQITEDWRFRMVTPPKGDFQSVPLTPEGRKAALAWDPGRDESEGNQCRGYGAAGLMRLPGHLHITWQDPTTLRLDADAGTQTRVLSFGPQSAGGGEWQGRSAASWDRPGSPMGFQFMLGGRGGASGGSLKVVTTNMRPGYLRKNGVPYSANAVLTEYFDRLDVPGGQTILVVSSEIVDPLYLTQPFWTSTHFIRQADAAWNPTPCTAR